MYNQLFIWINSPFPLININLFPYSADSSCIRGKFALKSALPKIIKLGISTF